MYTVYSAGELWVYLEKKMGLNEPLFQSFGTLEKR